MGQTAKDVAKHRKDVAEQIGPKIIQMFNEGYGPSRIINILDEAVRVKVTQLFEEYQ